MAPVAFWHRELMYNSRDTHYRWVGDRSFFCVGHGGTDFINLIVQCYQVGCGSRQECAWYKLAYSMQWDGPRWTNAPRALRHSDNCLIRQLVDEKISTTLTVRFHPNGGWCRNTVTDKGNRPTRLAPYFIAERFANLIRWHIGSQTFHGGLSSSWRKKQVLLLEVTRN
jgi:hypothetical protein